MDMIERVARAICQNTNIAMEGGTDIVLDNPDFVIPASRSFDKTSTPRWKLYIHQARAAIEAMREPTDAMWKAPCISGAEVGGVLPTGEESESIWRAMIDAALQSASNQSPPLENA